MFKRKTQRKKFKIHLLKQKIWGLTIIFVSLISIPLLNGDATGAIFMLPIGIYAVITKEKITDFDE
nr:MAG TPA: hypothetical protein [Caudoviricetes sp.]